MASRRFKLDDLEKIRRQLGMSRSTLARRSGVSEATVHRILSGRETSARFDNVLAIASAMGVDLGFCVDIERLRRREAKEKASRLVDMVQANSGLEGQAVGRGTYRRMVERTTRELLGGSNRRLWGD
jgi:transcriptional regulator with XRE-family HTH domain